MFTQERAATESPQLANLLGLAVHDGSDPWALAGLSPRDALELSPGSIEAEVRALYDPEECVRLVASPLEQPESWGRS